MNSFLYAIWLVPRAGQGDALQRVIDSLAARFGTLRFVTHTTLCSGVWTGAEEGLIERVDQLLGELPVSLDAGVIDWTERWSTFFFLRLCGGDALFQRAECVVEGAHGPELGPHVSLMYAGKAGEGRQGCLPHVGRDALRAELVGCLPERVRFDSLALVRPGSVGWADVAGWDIAHKVG
jgi:hypothetical protein